MKKPTKQRGASRGFTLIETIITILVAAVMGVLMYAILSQSLISSVESLSRVKNGQSLDHVVERINADYIWYVNNILYDNDTAPGSIGDFVTNYLDPNDEYLSDVTWDDPPPTTIFLPTGGGSEGECAGGAGCQGAMKFVLSKGDQRVAVLFSD
jgi:prepilin-type N-terminal cleavage/methylation domain-containing protein